jgi:hypothetical protein
MTASLKSLEASLVPGHLAGSHLSPSVQAARLAGIVSRFAIPRHPTISSSFGLLDSSMSLSPLYPHQTIDLHVRIATSLHQSFLWLHPVQAKITIFRVPSCVLQLESILRKTGRWCSLKASHLSLSLCMWVFHPNTRIHVRLLGPCFKTGRMKPFCQHP